MKRIFGSHWSDYELIDAGNEKKLERWGNIITIRPDRNAYFSPIQSSQEWKQKAHFEFIEETSSKGTWNTLKKDTPKEWQISYKNCVFNLRLTQFKHLGIFPEQQTNSLLENSFSITGRRASSLTAYAVGSRPGATNQ